MRKLLGFIVLGLLAAACGSTTTATQTQTITQSASVSAPSPSLAEADGVETQTPEPPAPDPGSSFNDPVGVGQAGSVGNWKVSVAGFTSNADAAIAQENMFNDKPRTGEKFVMVTLKVSNQGTKAVDPFWGLEYALVTSEGKVISGDSGRAYWNVLPNDFSDVGKVPAGLNASGNVAFDVKLDSSVAAIYVAQGNKGTFLSLK